MDANVRMGGQIGGNWVSGLERKAWEGAPMGQAGGGGTVGSALAPPMTVLPPARLTLPHFPVALVDAHCVGHSAHTVQHYRLDHLRLADAPDVAHQLQVTR